MVKISTCSRVVDGDTFIANQNGKEIKVRLIGVDTPEAIETEYAYNTTIWQKKHQIIVRRH